MQYNGHFQYWPDDDAGQKDCRLPTFLQFILRGTWISEPQTKCRLIYSFWWMYCVPIHRKWCTVTHSDHWRELLIFFSPVERGGACCPAQFRCLHGHTWFKWTGRYLPDHLTQVWWSRETFALHLQPHLSSSHRHKHLAVFIFLVLLSKFSVHTWHHVWSEQNLWFYLNWTSLQKL